MGLSALKHAKCSPNYDKDANSLGPWHELIEVVAQVALAVQQPWGELKVNLLGFTKGMMLPQKGERLPTPLLGRSPY